MRFSRADYCDSDQFAEYRPRRVYLGNDKIAGNQRGEWMYTLNWTALYDNFRSYFVAVGRISLGRWACLIRFHYCKSASRRRSFNSGIG